MLKEQNRPTYAELIGEIVQKSQDPISIEEITRRVGHIRPSRSRTPKGTIRNAIIYCEMVTHVGQGKYGWYPRLINGSRVRVPLISCDGYLEKIVFDDEAQNLLRTPSFTSDSKPVDLRLPNGAHASLQLELSRNRVWETAASPELWQWLKKCSAASGDALIIEAVDTEARCYSAVYESQRKRDAAAIRDRTKEIENVSLDYVEDRDLYPSLFGLAERLLARGYYKHPVPPEPISCIWNRVAPDPTEQSAYADWVIGRRQVGGNKKSRSVYQLKILLSESNPPIWRRVLATDTTTLNDLHWIIQQSMGWTDCHLHQFIIDGQYYSDPEFGLHGCGADIRDECNITLREIGAKKPDRFFYEYDFGDRWFHEIVIEKIDRLNSDGYYPQCIGGARACPPEDSHGVDCYADFLRAIQDPGHYDHEESLVWIKGYFDPEHFNLDLVNKKFRYGTQEAGRGSRKQ